MCTKHATVPSGILSPEHNRQKAAQLRAQQIHTGGGGGGGNSACEGTIRGKKVSEWRWNLNLNASLGLEASRWHSCAARRRDCASPRQTLMRESDREHRAAQGAWESICHRLRSRTLSKDDTKISLFFVLCFFLFREGVGGWKKQREGGRGA